VLGGHIPSVINHPLGSNIQHILEDIDLDLEEFVEMKDDNMGPTVVTEEAVKTARKPCPQFQRQGYFSGSDPQKALESDSYWSQQGRVKEASSLGGDLRGNPFKAVVDLIPHKEMKIERGVFARSMAKSMLHFQICISVLGFLSVFHVIYYFL
jgi:hypothetical protein